MRVCEFCEGKGSVVLTGMDPVLFRPTERRTICPICRGSACEEEIDIRPDDESVWEYGVGC